MFRRIRRLLHRDEFERDLAEEMTFHRDMAERELARDGVSPHDAELAARRTFGSSALAGDQARDVWLWPWIQDLARDFRLAFRFVARNRGFAAVAALVLGLGIGVLNIQTVILNAHCIRGLPIEDADRVLYIAAHDAQDREHPLTDDEFDALRTQFGGARAIAAFATSRAVVGDEGLAPDRAIDVIISAAGFPLLGEKPLLGRGFDEADERPGAQPVAILSNAFWRSRYAGDPSIVGRTVRINGVPTAVVGVMRDPFRFPAITDLWQPLTQPGTGRMPGTVARRLTAIARLRGDIGQPRVDTELQSIMRRLARDAPEVERNMRLVAVPINERYSGRLTDPVWLTFIGVGVIVLLIACANAANLLLMRAAGRGHEMAVRASLGASRSQIVRQLLIESCALALVGGAVGAVFAYLGIHAVARMIPAGSLPYWLTYSLDARLFGVLALACLGTVFLFGLVPAIHVAKTDVVDLVKEGGRGGIASARASRWTTAFLVAEFALTIFMVSTLVLGWRNVRAATRAAIVVDPAGLVTAGVTLTGDRYRSADARLRAIDELTSRMETIPGVGMAAWSTALPFGGGTTVQVTVAGREPGTAVPPPTALSILVSDHYFSAMSLGLVRGRAFEPGDGRPGQPTAIVNERLAQAFFPDGGALGARIRAVDPGAGASPSPWLTIVGIAPTVRQRGLPQPDPVVYLPVRSAPPVNVALIVRTAGDDADVARPLREAAARVDPNLPLYRLMTLDTALTEAQWNGRLSNALLDGIVSVAICLAMIGAYAAAAHSVVRRRREIGLRIALGARPADIVRMVLWQAGRQLALGLIVGIVGLQVFERLPNRNPASVLTQQQAHLGDPMNVALVCLMLVAMVAVACIVPVRHATSVDPGDVLKSE